MEKIFKYGGITTILMKRDRQEVAKDILILIIIFFVLGLLPDVGFHLRDKCTCIDTIILNLYNFFQPFHLTYHSALENLRNSIGIIMSVVSLLLSTYINFVQRLEKNPFGITYRELQEVEKGFGKRILRWTRWISYITPVMLVFVLNFGLCVTGYMLHFFCWLFLFLQLYFYVESFRKDTVPEKVVKVILRSLPDIEDWRGKDVQKLDTRLNEMLVSIQKDGNWSEINLIYEAFLKEMTKYDIEKKALLSEHFFECFCCEQDTNPIWNLCILHFNQEEYLEEDKDEYAYFWGMLRGILRTKQERNICKLIDDMLDVRRQGIEVCKAVEDKSLSTLQVRKQCTRLDIQKVETRSAMLLVLLEDMFQMNGFATRQIVERIFRLKKYGDEIFEEIYNNDMLYIIDNVVKDVIEQERLKNIVYSLHMDKQNNIHRCYINSCIDVL